MKKTSSPVAETLSRLERWLAKHRPRYRRALLPGATVAELTALEQALGVSLPVDLRALLTWHNGQSEEFAGAFEESWLLLGSAAIAATKRELNADHAETGWQPAWVPFLDDDQGDFLCLDTSQAGAPVRAFWLGEEERPIVASSLAVWLSDFVSGVEKGAYTEDPERGTFFKASKM